MKNHYAFRVLLLCLITAWSTSAQTWVQITTDATGDQVAGMDGEAASYYYDASSDSIWFKIDVADLAAHSTNFGINVMIEIPGASNSFNFWGATNMDAYHKLVTVWVTGSPPSGYSGTIGIADGIGVGTSNYTNLHNNNISIEANVAGNSVILGMERKDLITDSEMGGPSATLKTAVATGSSVSWGDDLYSPTASITIATSTVDLPETSIGKISVFPNPAADHLTIKGLEIGSKLRLSELSGRTVLEGVAIEGNHTLQLHKLPRGSYLLSVEIDARMEIRKIHLQ